MTVASSLSLPSVASRTAWTRCWTASRGCIAAPAITGCGISALAALRSSMPSVRKIRRSPGSSGSGCTRYRTSGKPERRVRVQRHGLEAAVAESQGWRMAGVDDRGRLGPQVDPRDLSRDEAGALEVVGQPGVGALRLL